MRVCVSGSLMYLNEATLLNNIRVRYSKDKIYVSVGLLAFYRLFLMADLTLLHASSRRL